jgi:hypothetical protein
MAFLQGLSDFFFGSKPRTEQISRFTPQQQGLQNQSIQQLLQMLQQGQGQSPSFEPIAQKARTQFQTQTIPSLAERFTSMGNRHSGAFKAALGNAGAGLEEGLAALGSQYGLQQNAQNQQLLQLLGSLGSQQGAENLVYEGQPGALQGLAGGLGNYFAPGIGGAIGGGVGWLGNRLFGPQ